MQMLTCVQALCDPHRIAEVAHTKRTYEVLVQGISLEHQLHTWSVLHRDGVHGGCAARESAYIIAATGSRTFVPSRVSPGVTGFGTGLHFPFWSLESASSSSSSSDRARLHGGSASAFESPSSGSASVLEFTASAVESVSAMGTHASLPGWRRRHMQS